MCKNQQKAIEVLRDFSVDFEYGSRYAVFSVLDGTTELIGVVGVRKGGRATAYSISERGGVQSATGFSWRGYVSRRTAAQLMGYPIELSNCIRVRQY